MKKLLGFALLSLFSFKSWAIDEPTQPPAKSPRALVFELGNTAPDITPERPSFLPVGYEGDSEYIPGPDDIAQAISTATTREAKNAAIDAFLQHRYLDQVDELTFSPDRETVLKKWLDTEGALPIVLATNDAGAIVFAGTFEELHTADANLFYGESLQSRIENFNSDATALAHEIKWDQLEIGGPAPDIKGQITLDPEKLTVIEFFATWCRHCMEAVPAMNRLHSQFGDKINLQVFGAFSRQGSTEVEKAAKFAQFLETYKTHIQFPATYATEETIYHWMIPAFKSQQEMQVPFSLVVDPSGKILFMGDPKDLEAVITAIHEGKWNETSELWARYERAMSLGRWEESLQILDLLKTIDPESSNIYTLKQAQNLTTLIPQGVARAKALLQELSEAFVLDPANLARVLTLYIHPRILPQNRNYKAAEEIVELVEEELTRNRAAYNGKLFSLVDPLVEYYRQHKDFKKARELQEAISSDLQEFESPEVSPEAREYQKNKSAQTLLDIAEQSGEMSCEARSSAQGPQLTLPVAHQIPQSSVRPTAGWEELSPRPRSSLP